MNEQDIAQFLSLFGPILVAGIFVILTNWQYQKEEQKRGSEDQRIQLLSKKV